MIILQATSFSVVDRNVTVVTHMIKLNDTRMLRYYVSIVFNFTLHSI